MAGGGGAWKVAYADFVTAMMALFMVLWIIGQNQKVKEAIAEHFNGEEVAGDGDSGGGRSQKMKDPHSARNLGEGGKRRPVAGVRPSDRTSIGVVVHFPPHQAALDEAARKALETFAPQILGKPQLIEVRGQSSLAEVGGSEHAGEAYQLAYQRCLAVMENLVSQGISPKQLRISQASPYDRPAADDESPHGDPAARVIVTVLSEWVGGSDQSRPKKAAVPARGAPAHDAHGAPAHAPAHGAPAHDEHH